MCAIIPPAHTKPNKPKGLLVKMGKVDRIQNKIIGFLII
ncbi:MAG: hypothetical protein JWM44_4341, partial [Bacilli bacterium]|nr:hypothetical protein [Bacilli bacterium]